MGPQAQNISIPDHKAVSCHSAAMMRVQSLRNRDMLPTTCKTALENKLSAKRLLVIDEISMISPALYNMLLYRFYLGRKKRWEIAQERFYVQGCTAFGRMPLVLYLGDFLQLRLTAGTSLREDMDALAHDPEARDVPVEFQDAARFFLQTSHCYELTTTNRFHNDEGGCQLKELIEFMRSPSAETSEAYKRVVDLWQTIQLDDGGDDVDARLFEARFQQGHMLAIYWETVGPWMTMRAQRDAHTLQTPLFCLQAADHASPPMGNDQAAKLLNHYNPLQTGGMHGMLLLHLGMRVRLAESICKEKRLVKDAEGTVVKIVVDPADEEAAAHAFNEGSSNARVYLTRVPSGIWLQMDKYDEAPFVDMVASSTNISHPDVESLVFLEPANTLMPFRWREFKITRGGFPLTHAMVRTSTACQGKTCEQGVLVDCARRVTGLYPMEDDDCLLLVALVCDAVARHRLARHSSHPRSRAIVPFTRTASKPSATLGDFPHKGGSMP